MRHVTLALVAACLIGGCGDPIQPSGRTLRLRMAATITLDPPSVLEGDTLVVTGSAVAEPGIRVIDVTLRTDDHHRRPLTHEAPAGGPGLRRARGGDQPRTG
jgi:uncharacterized lipoprotein YmbA